jgi:hypothetical protein
MTTASEHRFIELPEGRLQAVYKIGITAALRDGRAADKFTGQIMDSQGADMGSHDNYDEGRTRLERKIMRHCLRQEGREVCSLRSDGEEGLRIGQLEESRGIRWPERDDHRKVGFFQRFHSHQRDSGQIGDAIAPDLRLRRRVQPVLRCNDPRNRSLQEVHN